MNILILAQNYPPDHSAGAFRIKSLVDELLSQGHKVAVLTGSPNRFDPSKAKGNDNYDLPKEKIHRIPAFNDKGGIWKRGLGYSLFFIDALPKTFNLARKSDVIVATTPQLLVGFLGGIGSKLTGTPLVLDVRDLWPDVMHDMGVLSKSSKTYRILKKIELFLYKQAEQIIVNSPAFVNHIIRNCGKKPNIITNGLDDKYFKNIHALPAMEKNNPYRVTYAGNIGIAQDLQPVLEVAENFKGKLNFRFIGQGSDRTKLEQIKNEKNLSNVEFIEPVPRADLMNYYAQTDAFLVHLKNIPMFEKTIPSKIFEYVATGKPVVYGLNGVSAKMMNNFQGDLLRFTSEDKDSLNNALKNLVDVMEKRIRWDGNNGIAKIEQNYLRSSISSDFAQIVEICGEHL